MPVKFKGTRSRSKTASRRRTGYRAKARKSGGRFQRRTYSGPYATKLPPSAFMAEKKLVALQPFNERGSLAIQVGAQASYRGFVMGSKPTQWTGTWDALGGMVITRGTSVNQRDGQYVFLSHSNLFFNVDTQAVTASSPPMECRLIVFRARRAANPAGVAYDPANSLFLNDIGTPVGHSTGGINGFDLCRRITNKRDWIIQRDHRFMLSKPFTSDSEGGVLGYTGKYPCARNFRFKLPYYKKTRFDATSNLPTDAAYHWGVILYVRSIGKDSSTASQVECNTRGQTVFLDP